MKNRTKLIRAIPALLATLALVALVGCGNVGSSGGSGPSAGDDSGGGGPTITVGSKNFTEQYVLGELYAQALEANGFNAETKLDLGSSAIADKALQNGQIDMYPEYTGTALVEIFKQMKQPDTPNATYQEAKAFIDAMDIDEQSHEFGDGDAGMSVIELDRCPQRQQIQIAIGA